MVVELFINRIKELHPEFKFTWREPLNSSFLSRSILICTNFRGQDFNMNVRLNDFVVSDEYINMIVHRFKAQEQKLNAQTKK